MLSVAKTSPLIERLFAQTAALSAAFSRNRARFRLPLLLLALALFLGGSIFSFRQLELDPGDLRMVPLLALVLLIAPAAVVYSAINMMLMGKAICVPVGFARGLRVSVYAQAAELLPIPGGTIVRAAALMRCGGGGMKSTGIVLAFALLWIAFAALGGGWALLGFGHVGQSLFAGGMIVVIAINFWIGRSYGWKIAFVASGLRLVGLALVAVRMVIAFAVLGLALQWAGAFGFAFGVILGGAASIVPAGLGIGESISALVAVPLAIDPAAAFLAVAIGRLIGLGVNMLGVVGFMALDARTSGQGDI